MRSANIRQSFHFKLMSACQRFICEVTSNNGANWRGALADLVEGVQPLSPFEEGALRDALARLAVSAHHTRRFPDRKWIVEFGHAVEAIVTSPLSMKDAHRRWRARSESHRLHNDPDRVDALVRGAGPERVLISVIAKDAGKSARSMRQEFRKAHGMSPRECRMRTLVVRMMQALRSSELKVSSVALELGIRSPKNAYRALKVYAGLTPQQVRTLTSDEFALLCARMQTVCGDPARTG